MKKEINAIGMKNICDLVIHIKKTTKENQATNYCIRELLRKLTEKSNNSSNHGLKIKGCSILSKGADKAITDNDKSKKLIADHAIPISLFIKEFNDFFKANENINSDDILKMAEKYSIIVLITKDEDDVINSKNLKESMPEDWDGLYPFSRYYKSDIEIYFVTEEIKSKYESIK